MIQHQLIQQLINLEPLRLRPRLQTFKMLKDPTSPSATRLTHLLSSKANSRSRNLLGQLPMKPLGLLQRLQPSNSPAIFNPIRKERRQDLDLLSGKELRRECSDHSSEIGHGFAPQYRVFVVDIFAQGLHDFDQGGVLILDTCSHGE